MPGLELHADFDRDGRLTRSAAERAARSRWPGAVVVPNMDRDRLRLPTSVSNTSMSTSDYERVSTLSGDNELLQVEIRDSVGTMQPGETLHLRCSGVMHTRVKLSDDTGRIVPHRLRAPEIYDLPLMPTNGVMVLFLQVRTIAGAAFGRVSNINLSFRDDPREESHFTLTLLRRDLSGTEHEEDEGRFSVAPFILADRTAPVRRVYMVSTPSNRPSVTDMHRVVRAARVPLIEIDPRLTNGDTWVQDQYQHSFMQGPNGWNELILHLPRLRHDSTGQTTNGNLEEVVNTHFRSQNVGLFRDLWDRVIPVRSEDNIVVRPSFRALDSWVKRASRVHFVNHLLIRYARDADPDWQMRRHSGWVDVLLHLDTELARVHRALDGARAEASYQREQQIEAEKAAASTLVDQIKAEFPVSNRRSSDPVIESDLVGQRIRLRASFIEKLFDRARQMHGSMNYGGNIESTPPVTGAPLGKIILGNVTISDTGQELIDPDLLRVFAKQRKQPIVEINTAWLKVGHIDEMMAVVPSTRASGGFSILHVSSKAAIELLEQSQARYLNGLPMAHPDRVRQGRPPSGVLPRLMVDGSSPVTRLFRGKSWLHRQPPPRIGQVQTHIEPPDIYMRLCQAFGSSTASTGVNVHDIGYVPGEGGDRRYPADITVNELLWAEADHVGRSSNGTIRPPMHDSYDSALLEPSREILRAAFPGNAILPIPVIFDRTHDVGEFRRNFWDRPTTAFSPDMANMQVLNGHLVVPKPYGPRMKIDDAITVVKDTMTALNLPGNIKSRVGRGLINSRRMTRGEYWVEKVNPAYLTSRIGTIRASYGGITTKADVIAVFRDSFPDADSAELERRIFYPNRHRFTNQGYLRDDFGLFRINDNMVDIFELFVAAIAAELHVELHFVDSWSYHLFDGQIHCGTNVLRGRPLSNARLPNVWDAPDHPFRTRVIEFEEDDLTDVLSQP